MQMLTALVVGWNNLFEYFFAVFVLTLDDMSQKQRVYLIKTYCSKPKQMFKLKFDFDFNVKLVISRQIIYSNKDVIRLLQSKSNDFLTGFHSI